MMETMTTLSQQPLVSRENCATKMQDMANFLGRDQAIHYQPEVDSLRRQIKSQTEKDKMYKEQIADLKQQLSRRYMAAKTEERKVSNREMQLERKLKTLEEELHKARIQLDREYRVQEAKRLKVICSLLAESKKINDFLCLFVSSFFLPTPSIRQQRSCPCGRSKKSGNTSRRS